MPNNDDGVSVDDPQDDEDVHPWLRGFGAFEDSDLPERMKEERRKSREEWSDGE